ncbi:serine hydrolase domain-containing protein [Luteimonas saliphila]|uniref:serine hydrolase domain-containing protein n=1 Tax=Luteimonas saliphila TaxID=2804919 RepID=UPI00192D4E59|nr:serine hydrolase domain-containing protein [Luteimonas saliphila]
MRKHVVEAGYPGARMLVLHGEEVVADVALGHADIAGTRPLRGDAIFRIHSMTKPVVSAAALRLVDEGHATLDDPVSRHLPGLADWQVMEADGRLREPLRPPTIRHLLTHTAGFPVSEGEPLRRREAAAIEESATLADYVERLQGVPLERDPGTRFTYDSAATEILGRLVEVWSGQPLDAYLRDTFFVPLGMVDTGFEVPVQERGRVVELSRADAQGRLVLADESHARNPGTRLRPYTGAAGGLYSTAADYLAFARLLRDRGSAGGRRLLPTRLVDEMFRDQLAPMGVEPAYIDETPGRGFGLGVSVLLDPAALGREGAAGQVGWTGAGSTYFVIDPATRTVAVLLLQHLPSGEPGDLPRVATAFYNQVQQAVAP